MAEMVILENLAFHGGRILQEKYFGPDICAATSNKMFEKRQKTQYFEFYRFLVFWPTRCVPVKDPKLPLKLVTSSMAYLEAF